MSDVFISYAHEDAEFVDRLRAALVARSRDVWVDTAGIEPADRWRVSADEAIERSDAFLFVVSAHSLRSAPCLGEFEHAQSLNKRVIPVCVDDAAVEMDKPQLLDELSWIMLREGDDFDTGLNAIERALDTDLEVVRTHTRILVRAKAWELAGRRTSPLLRGDELRLAEQWLARAAASGTPPNELQQDFIAASRHAATRRLRTIATVAVGIAVIAVALSIYALVQRSNAISNQKIALSRALAGEALDAFSVDGAQPDRGVLLSLEAYRQSPTDAARASVLTALEYTDRVDGFISAAGPITDVTYTNGGTLLTAAGGADFTAQTWDAASLAPRGAAVPPDPSLQARALSPNGRFVAGIRAGGTLAQLRRVIVRELTSSGEQTVTLTASDDATSIAVTDAGEVVIGTNSGIEVWSLASRKRIIPPFRFAGFQLSVLGVAASADGSVVAGETGIGNVVVMDVARRRSFEIKVGLRARSGYAAISVSPDGRLVAAGFAGGYYVLWRIDAAGSPHQLGGPRLSGSSADVSAVRLAAGDQLLAVGKADGSAQLWRVGGGPLMFLREDALEIDALAFDPTGTHVAIGAADRHVTLWNVHEPGGRYVSPLADLLAVPLGWRIVDHVAFSSGGGVLAAAGYPGGVRLYDSRSGEPYGPELSVGPSGVSAMSFDSAGRALVTLGADGVIHAWDVGDPRAPKPMSQPPSAGASFPAGGPISALSPDARLIAVVTRSGRAIAVIDRMHPQPVPVLLHFPSASQQGSIVLGFNHFGTMLAAGNGDGSLDLWDLTRPAAPAAQLAPPSPDEYAALAFSPDGRRLAAANRRGGTFSLWDTGSHRAVISGLGTSIGAAHGFVTTLAFSPDGAVLATGDSVGQMRLWDVARGQQLGRALLSSDVPNDGIGELSFSPAGAQIAVAAAGSTLIRWSRLLWPGTQIGPRARRLCAIAGRNLTRSEWSVFVPGVAYHATCPQWSA